MKRIRSIIQVALMTAFIAVCALISIPTAPPFTLQSFAVFLAIFNLGARKGFLSILVYILIGVMGIPVFSGFGAGPGALFGPSGGYLVSFLLIPPIFSLIARTSTVRTALSCILSMLICYLCGTLWFMHIYSISFSIAGVFAAICSCILPFIIPDTLKILLALSIHKRIVKWSNINVHRK